ncbi:hypothetical protein OR60_22985, partial [Xanthomonas vesicatoria]
PSFLQLPLICTAGVLRALVTMVDCALRWPSAVQRHGQRSAGQRLIGPLAHRPARDLPAVHV